ncbi:hypothetical protein ACRYI5_00490 [Furfurilactobacillus sp. WILCCON 0119]
MKFILNLIGVFGFLLGLTVTIGICFIVYRLVKRSGNKRLNWIALIGLMLLSVPASKLINLAPWANKFQSQNNYQQSQQKSFSKSSTYSLKSSTSSSSSSRSNASRSQNATSTIDKYANLKIGMSSEQVIKIMGQPTDRNDSTLYYGNDDLDFSNDQLIGGSPKSLQDKAAKAYKDQSKTAEKSKQDHDTLQSKAKVFGQLSVAHVQKYVGSAYSSARNGDDMQYGWKTDGTMLVRDDDQEGFTTVYVENSDGSLQQPPLYTGKTIQQDKTTVWNLYGK